LNILYAGTLPPHPGGSAISAALLLEGLAAGGHRVRAVAPLQSGAEGRDSFAADNPGIAVRRYAVPYYEPSPDRPASEEYREAEGSAVRAELARSVAAERPDVILLGRETFAWHVPEVAAAAGVPCVLRAAGATTIGLLRGTYPNGLRERLLAQYRKAALIVSPAHHLAESLRQWGLERVQVIPNGVDLQRFSPQPKDLSLARELRIADDDVVLMHISNLKALKRSRDMVAAADRALPQNDRLVFVVVGDGPERRGLEQECALRRLSDRFRFVGWIEYAEMPRYVNLADAVILPSEAEAQARAYLETQACGRVLIASDVAGAREVVNDGETGLLFPRGDIAGLTGAMLRAAGDPVWRAEIGEQARQRVQAHSLTRCVAAYLAALREVVKSSEP
jgi:glycosyltransferase involved in cell wall biosynthesis